MMPRVMASSLLPWRAYVFNQKFSESEGAAVSNRESAIGNFCILNSGFFYSVFLNSRTIQTLSWAGVRRAI
jgi:hypothetical protein